MSNRRGALRLLILSLLGSMCMGVASTATATQGGAAERLRAFVARVHAAQGVFTQVQAGRSGKVTGTSSGDFVFARPGKFIWKTVKPFEQLLQSDGDKLYLWDRDLNQVTVRKLGDALTATPAGILFGGGDLDKLFTIQPGPTRDGVDWVELIPRARDGQFERIAVGFRGEALAGMELRDALGNATALSFGPLTLNPALPADRFRFRVPAGADVVEN